MSAYYCSCYISRILISSVLILLQLVYTCESVRSQSVRIRQHTSENVNIRQHIRESVRSQSVRIRQHTSENINIRQHIRESVRGQSLGA